MPKIQLLRGALRLATGLLLALVFGIAPVRAALYTGAWDPLFGTPLDTAGIGFDLIWTGTYAVNADCPLSGSGYLAACTPASATVAGATVTLTRTGGGSTTIDFSNASMTISDVFWENSPNNVISKLKTNVSDFLAAPAASLADTTLDTALASYTFALQFYLDGSGSPGSSLGFGSIPGYSGPVLFARTASGSNAGSIFRANVNDPNPIFQPQFRGLVRQNVPEPAALTLVVGAMFAASLVGRRRRARLQ